MSSKNSDEKQNESFNLHLVQLSEHSSVSHWQQFSSLRHCFQGDKHSNQWKIASKWMIVWRFGHLGRRILVPFKTTTKSIVNRPKRYGNKLTENYLSCVLHFERKTREIALSWKPNVNKFKIPNFPQILKYCILNISQNYWVFQNARLN